MRKAQAAMEFLMTYGWAILVVLVAIGALAYFGVLNPGKFLPSSCVVVPGVSCDSHQIKADGAATIILRNGMGNALSDVKLGIGGVAGTCTGSTSLADGATTTCTWAAAALTPGAAGGKFKADLNFTYTDASDITHTKIGTLVTNVEG